MIKVFGFIARRPDLTAEQFHDHYRHPHGTMARHMPTLLSYTQAHQIDTMSLDATQRRFEAIMETRLAGREDWFGFRTIPYLVEHLLEDEPNFLDAARCAGIATAEELLPPPPKETLVKADALWSLEKASIEIKLVQIVPHAKADLWARDHDAELGYRIGALRHARCRAIPDIQARGNEYCGVRELWWPTVSAFHTGIAGDPEAWRRLKEQTGSAATMLVRGERFF
jgi:hypothetical protein